MFLFLYNVVMNNIEVENLFKTILNEVKSFRITFKYNCCKISVILNSRFFKRKEFLVLIENKSLQFPIIKYFSNKYGSKFKENINIESHKLKGKDIEYAKGQLNEYKSLFLYPLLNSKSDGSQSLDKFWNTLFKEVNIENVVKINHQEIKKIYSRNNSAKDYGIYINNFVKFEKNKISKDMINHLENYFNVPSETIAKLKSRGLTIRTTWEANKHDKVILKKLMDNTF